MPLTLSDQQYVLKDLIAVSKDGEWGHGEQAGDVTKMSVIRGTDFESVRSGDLSGVPVRFIATRNAERKTLRPLDIVMEMAGGAKNRPTGRTLLLNERVFQNSASPVTCASFCRFIRIDPELANPEYVYWLLQYLYTSQQIHQFNTQHTGLSRFQYTKFATTLRFRIHDRDQQDKIAAILRDYDDLIENNRHRIVLLEDAAQQLYKEWFVRLRYPGHEQARIVDGVPEGWGRKLLPEIVEINPRTPINKHKLSMFVPMAGLSETLSIITDTELRTGGSGTKFRNYDTLLARITPCIENGKTAMVQILPDGETGFGSTEFIVLRSRSVSPTWVYCFARTEHLRQTAINSMKGSDGRQRVNPECFMDYAVLQPPVKVLDQFDSIAGAALCQVHSLFLHNQRLMEARELLLPRLMCGEIEV